VAGKNIPRNHRRKSKGGKLFLVVTAKGIHPSRKRDRSAWVPYYW
jgi:hypothetical protein